MSIEDKTIGTRSTIFSNLGSILAHNPVDNTSFKPKKKLKKIKQCDLAHIVEEDIKDSEVQENIKPMKDLKENERFSVRLDALQF